MTTYTRSNPSPRYRELQALYATLHRDGDRVRNQPAEAVFAGGSLPRQASRIKRLVERTDAATLLDYGSGKGVQYAMPGFTIDGEGTWENIVDYWGVAAVQCYDPAYQPFNRLPEGRFDGVVCTDVLEHCPEEDLDWILREVFGFAERFVFFSIACFPADRRLPNGENAHCTIRPVDWWSEVIGRVAAERPELLWEFWAAVREPGEPKREPVEVRRGNFEP